MNIAAAADALLQGRPEIHRPAMFSQQVAQRLIGEGVEINPALAREKRNRLPELIIDLNALCWHNPFPHPEVHRRRRCLEGSGRDSTNGGTRRTTLDPDGPSRLAGLTPAHTSGCG